jgi:hypothetical protein
VNRIAFGHDYIKAHEAHGRDKVDEIIARSAEEIRRKVDMVNLD